MSSTCMGNTWHLKIHETGWFALKLLPDWSDCHGKQNNKGRPSHVRCTQPLGSIFSMSPSLYLALLGFHLNWICINKHVIRQSANNTQQTDLHASWWLDVHSPITLCAWMSLCPQYMPDGLRQESSMGLDLFQQILNKFINGEEMKINDPSL